MVLFSKGIIIKGLHGYCIFFKYAMIFGMGIAIYIDIISLALDGWCGLLECSLAESFEEIFS